MLLSSLPIIAWSPFGVGSRVAIAAARAGALGVVELRGSQDSCIEAIRRVTDHTTGAIAVRVGSDTPLGLSLSSRVSAVIVDDESNLQKFKTLSDDRQLIAVVTSLVEAHSAVAAGADALIVSGSEAGGRVGVTSTFILLQQVLGQLSVPVYARGGIGLHTAAAAFAAGAVGVVLDEQLSLCKEVQLTPSEDAAIKRLDGSESRVEEQRRITSLGAPNDTTAPEWPLGEAASFAARYAERFRTVGGVVQAISRAMHDGVVNAAAQKTLTPGSPFADEHGTQYPIVQGPMTRVSDRAAFASAVASAGGLPFLALSLSRASQVESLLTETSEALGELPWGVGILGFVPQELREAQLDIVKRVKPPFALIAGGRPSQARPLEAVGIRTYLHAPSPALLELFLRDGARRFVFEGRECGGHVGPRSSFGLWEQQIETLLAFDQDLSSVSILFAGGIHDARSAAMVSAMAAALVARGARVGVLMGTAYIFTAEAVSAGAILESYQQDALACENTALLETAPGHATRCVENDYVRDFRMEQQRMVDEGCSKHEMWARLEQLNLGRLRIASKGVKRNGDQLEEVDLDTRQRQGMVMIGEAATLRSAVVTMHDLHRSVAVDSMPLLEARSLSLEPATAIEPQPAQVAIVGMACVFPGAPDLSTYWSNIIATKDVVREVNPERWNPDIYFDPDGKAGVTTPSKWGGFLDAVPFDPLEYGIPPRSLAAIEPVQLLALQVAKRALADAGYADREFDRSRASVIFGAEAGTDLAGGYGFRALWPQLLGELPRELDEVLPSLTEDSFPGVLANVIAGRIANRLDLGGANYTVDAACASSLASVDLGVKELLSGTSDLVLAGGADLHNSINDYLMFSSVHALSKSGRCRTFDAEADGIALGEGVAAVVLKRLEDAERDGDKVYAVVQAVAASSDGKHLGLTAPRKDGQKRALDRAYGRAGIDPSRVELIEAHGTGTIVGDRTELATLTETFSATEAPLARCTLGSVKSQIGHTKCAAGLAGLIKVALSVHHGIRPATLHIESPNPYYQPETSPFHFHKTPAPWATPERVAGVSAFGFGGTNYHAVVTSYDGLDTPFTSHDDWPAELFIFRASDETSLSKQISQVRDAIRAMLASDSLTIAWKLRDVAHHVSTLGDGPIRLALVADSFEQLLERLSSASIGEAGPGVYLGDGTTAEGQVAFLCPGQGSQRPGMLKDIFVAFPWLSQHLQGGQRWWQTLFPGHAFTAEAKAAQRRAITDTRVAQPTLGMVELAAADLLATFGIRPDCIAGHSYGELVALTVAGALNASDLPAISEGRGISILESAGADPGTMAAVSAGADEVAAALPRSSDVVLANLNSPTQTVISGATPAVEAAVQTLKAAGLSARPIRVACAFHSPVVSGAAERFSKILEPASVRSPQYQVWSNSTAKPYPASPDAIRTQLAEHVVSPVRFVEQIEAMWAAGARTFIECGPGRVLSGLTQKILGDRPHRTVAIDQSGQHGLLSLLNALGELAVAGLPVDTQVLFRGREVRDIQPGAPDRHGASIWWVDGQRAKPAQGELPASAMSPVTKPVTQVTMGGSPLLSSESEREQLVLEYLQSMRQMVETQREVMLSYLGTPALGEVPVAHRAGDSAGVGTDKRTSVLAEKASKVAELQESPREILLHLVSERTGYPLEMLDLDLDLEADLSIDSIKRLEILGALGERIGLTDDEDTAARDAMVEELAQLKTLRALIDWLDTQVPAIESSQEEEALPDVQELLLGLVSERTGYPLEMLGLDLDLEADLSIDSIKRLEILGALGEQVGFGEGTPDERDQLVETLATKKTLRSIVEWLQSQIGAHASSSASEALPSEPDIEEPPPLQRFVVQVTPAPELGPTKMDLSGANVVIAPDDRGVAAALVEKLTVAGANPRLWNEDIVGGDVLIDLEGLRANGDQHPVKRSFDHAKVWAKTGAPKVLFASGLGGDFGRSYRGDQLPRGGSSGLLKSWMKESPALDAKLVDLDVESDAPDVLAGYVLSELIHKSGPSEVGWRAGERIQLSLGAQATSQDDENSVTLNAESVVLLTGGARGITARVAIALAEATGCSLELVGRSELPAPTDPPDIAEATDGAQLRRAFLARGETNLREVERLVRGVLSAREIRNTMQTLGDLGVDVNYHSVDVRDHEAVCSLVETIYEKRGRIDGVIHGAGVLDDRLMADKSAASFERVFDTKVIGAQALVERLRSDTQFVVFFSSVSGAFGNRGQVDYAAANDALDKLAFCLQQRIDGRVLSVNWGPWADTGMVNAALEREYRRRGIGLIPPDAGIRALLEELSSIQGPTQVVLMCADPSAMA